MTSSISEIAPSNANETCVGPNSADAGQASSCAGCPNQSICLSGQPRQPDPDLSRIASRLVNVRHKIVILSGKGGCGKSTLTSQLAWSLSNRENVQIGVLDLDICGPSIPRLFNVSDESIHQSAIGWTPVYARDNIGVLSVSFLMAQEEKTDQSLVSGRQRAIMWRGAKKTGMVKQFLRDVDWTDGLDFMLIDTPPGTSDEHLAIVQLLAESRLDGAILVTTPQQVCLQDVRKELDFCRRIGLPVLGIVENMRGFICPHCKIESNVFPVAEDGGKGLAERANVPFLGSIPLDPRLARACDEGEPFAERFAESPAAKAIQSITDRLCAILGNVPL